MGRRALRGIDPTLDLSSHYADISDPPASLKLADLFARTAPLEIEVGSGKGLFLQNAALSRVERNLLGIEVSRKYARFAAARLARRGLGNAFVLCADALQVFRDFVAADSVRAVHIYFPDPWWKKRHHKRRVMQADFVRHVERVLEPQGRLHFWTDVEEYFIASQDLLQRATGLQGPFEVAERGAEHDLDYQTHFERRTRQQGLPVYRAEFSKP